MKFFPACTALGLLVFARTAPAHEANAEMTAAATHFLAALNAEQKTQATFDFAGADRLDWHFIPRPRKGLPIKQMSYDQRLLALALLSSGLSPQGSAKALSIMSLESVLAELEKDRVGGAVRDPENYFFSVFGTPGLAPWGWRVEGHHLSLNFTCTDHGATALTPSFFGSNPGEVRAGPRAGLRILGAEEDLGRALVKSLSDEQRQLAILKIETPKEIFNDPKRIEPTKPEGIPRSQLTPSQSDALEKLLQEYLFRCRPDVAAEDLARIEKAGPAQLYFAWAGGLEPGQPHYYRIQGGHFVLEYDNTQNAANHAHSLWRDFDHDFAADLLKEHLDTEHPK